MKLCLGSEIVKGQLLAHKVLCRIESHFIANELLMKRAWGDDSDVESLKLIRCEQMYFLHHECRVRLRRKGKGRQENGLDSGNDRGQHFAGIKALCRIKLRFPVNEGTYGQKGLHPEKRIRKMN